MKENIESVSARKDITPVWVENKRTLSKRYYLEQFKRKYPNNRYASLVNIDDMILGTGLSIEKIKQITYKKARVVIFDWDLTLSVFNGIDTPKPFTFPKDIPIEHIAHFYAGSAKRFDVIQQMFSVLRGRGTRIYILSNNGWAQHPKEFVKLLRVYDPPMKPREILYGNSDKLKKINQIFTRKNLEKTT